MRLVVEIENRNGGVLGAFACELVEFWRRKIVDFEEGGFSVSVRGK